MLSAAGRGAWRLGQLERARALADRALAVAGDDRSRATALGVSGVLALFFGRNAMAAERLQESARLDTGSKPCST